MSNFLLGAVLKTDSFLDSLVLMSEYQQDNVGSKWLSENFPHIISQLNSMTLGWTLVPKAIVRNSDVLTSMLAAYKGNLQYDTSSESMMLHHNYEELISFLEVTVLPALRNMPDDRKETEMDAFAEAFAEDDIRADGGEPSGEEVGAEEEA